MIVKVTAIIERASDGSYSIYTKEDFEEFVLISSGMTPNEAIKDMYDVVNELKKEVRNMPELEFEFYYDVASFLREYKEKFSLSGLQIITGINQKQLHHYLTGHRKPSEKTVQKIQDGIRMFAEKLATIQLQK